MKMETHAQFWCTVFIVVCSAIVIDSTSSSVAPTPKASTESTTRSNNGTTHAGGPMLNEPLGDSWYGKNRGMLQRTFYVVLAITVIVVVYFGVRAWRTRRRTSKSRKYGLISTSADLEMEPLGNDMDDDEEDMTVFEQNGRRK